MACVFDLFSQHPLMFTAAAGSCSGNDFRAIGNKFTKLLRVGISRLFFLRTKKTELFSSGGIFIGTFLVVLFRFFEWHRLELYNFGRDLAINKYRSGKKTGHQLSDISYQTSDSLTTDRESANPDSIGAIRQLAEADERSDS